MIPESERSAANEARRACKPLIDPLQALRQSLVGGNHGIARLSASDTSPAPLSGLDRILAAIQKAGEKIKQEAARDRSQAFSATERKIAAQDLRERADALERGI